MEQLGTAELGRLRQNNEARLGMSTFQTVAPELGTVLSWRPADCETIRVKSQLIIFSFLGLFEHFCDSTKWLTTVENK